MPDTIVMKRKKGPDWVFEWNEDFQRFTHETALSVYFVVIDKGDGEYHFPDVWIGRLSSDRSAVFTDERRLGATELRFGRGRYVFSHAEEKEDNE